MNNNTPAQESLQLATPAGGATNVEKYKFEPIKGYPMLNWRGKRPFTSTQYYPAQLKEVHGEEVDGWRNKIFWGDNLQVMSHLLKQFRGKIDMVYIDPPFDSKADYRKKIHLKGITVAGDMAAFEDKQYGDLWTNDEYLQFMYERLVLLRELLTEEGSIWVQCDWHRSHHIRCLLEEIFGSSNFLNEVAWQRTDPHNDAKSRLGIIHDTIFWVAKNKEKVFYDWQAAAGDLSDSALSEYSLVLLDDGSVVDYSEETENLGRRFKVENTTYKGKDSKRQFEWRGVKPSPNRVWAYASPKEMDQALERGELYLRDPRKGSTRCKVFFLEKSNGRLLQSIWTDCGRMKGGSDYPTRKPEQLLERIITAGCPAGGVVLDTFVGSGTTAVAAQKLGRKFIVADINLGAVQSSTKRLINSAVEILQQPLNEEERAFWGFEIHNVNNYDIFRNPVQAKELLIEALEIQKLEFSTVFDGEKDGRMVKIMPVNRIATRADLNELIAGFDYKAWERKQNESPNRPVEKITLVCMGHEPTLRAELEYAAKPFKIDVEVVDILRDKADLEFKRDSQAKVSIKKGELVIEKFYPMNLLQKLSLQKESVEDWKELVESVLIDWNYDGAVLQPAVLDIPSKNDLVKGAYTVPQDAGTIYVKITDLLSESWEGSVSYGE
ncbi:site-specific DNA-methyltransferase [Nitrosomonas eutropha]|uniref:site-specific DNA-methyltransferase (adenine-specific) n=2 Tax=Nitrosomonas eutropha TaxID=916 RepID=Q0ACW4_NITEC|nr:site-specific DNA-methyltransferase [Nitrosomonas eutropha]ABI60749.1 DNA methylase N-4/N-6 domain protein [Nitrosomonas eutropha C91]ABI60807.1 DNA methylase N-4/N-6 domain protein [Nitrosomonas eutropha C91]PXV74344.1 site-specific DNA-methyltransferase (adenine-specific)/adenine-specific DNA-methyltransferase [Nitrosomonas eutropha]